MQERAQGVTGDLQSPEADKDSKISAPLAAVSAHTDESLPSSSSSTTESDVNSCHTPECETTGGPVADAEGELEC